MSDDLFKTAEPAVDKPAESGDVFLKVGDRAFNTPDDAVKKITAADEHIAKLESEAAALRETMTTMEEKLKQAATLESVMEEVRTSSNGHDPMGTTSPAGLQKEDVTKIAEEVLASRATEAQRAANLKSTYDSAVTHFGSLEKAQKAISEGAGALGMTVEEAKAMAETKPTAFKKLFMAEAQQQPKPEPNVTRGGVNVAAQAAVTDATKGGYAYYKHLMKTDPKNYASYMDTVIEKVRSEGRSYYET